MTHISTSLIILFLLTTFAQGQTTKGRLLIENVHVIPMHIHSTLENMDVVIENGNITQVRRHTDKDESTYDLGRIDGTGKYLIPAFSDAHVHLPQKENLEAFFLMNLLNGVTTLRSMRGEAWHADIDQQTPFTPRLFLGSSPVSHRDSLSHSIANQLVAQHKNAGFDFIKVLSTKTPSDFDYLVNAANKYNMPLAGHAPSVVNLFTLCNSKCYQSIEHLGGFFTLPDMSSIIAGIEQTIDANIFHCPTLDWYYTGQVKEETLRKRTGVSHLPKQQIQEWEAKITEHYDNSTEEGRTKERSISKQRFDTRLIYLGFIYRQGGQLLLSPDASGIYGIPGFGIHTEMQHYADAKISNYDILKSTCYNLAKMFGEQDQWGTIKAGSQSDMILLNANPLEDIKNTQSIEGIILKGNYHSHKALKEQLDALKQ